MSDAKGLDVFVLDAGAHTFRAGRGEDTLTEAATPRILLPSAVKSCDTDSVPSSGPDKGVSQVFDDKGHIASWDGYETVASHIFYDLLDWPEGDEGYVVATECFLRTVKSDREKLAQMMFETFNLRGYYVVDSAVAALYAYGKVTGVCVDVGHTGTSVSQVCEGVPAVGNCHRYSVGGATLNSLLKDQLQDRGLSLRPEQIVQLKERCAAVADGSAEYKAALDTASEKPSSQSYELPDGQSVSVGTEGLTLGEALFSPADVLSSYLDSSLERPLGAAEAAYACIMMQPDPSLLDKKTSNDQQPLRKQLLENVVVCGGPATIPALHARFSHDMRVFLPSSSKFELLKPPEYMPEVATTKFAPFVGASVVAKFIESKHMMTKEDYDERGPSYINFKTSL